MTDGRLEPVQAQAAFFSFILFYYVLSILPFDQLLLPFRFPKTLALNATYTTYSAVFIVLNARARFPPPIVGRARLYGGGERGKREKQLAISKPFRHTAPIYSWRRARLYGDGERGKGENSSRFRNPSVTPRQSAPGAPRTADLF